MSFIDSFLLGECWRKLRISDLTMESLVSILRKFFRNWLECCVMESAWLRFLVDICFCFSTAARRVAILWAIWIDLANMGLSWAIVSSVSFIMVAISCGVSMSVFLSELIVFVMVFDMTFIWSMERFLDCFFDRME